MPTTEQHLIQILKDDACEEIFQVFEPSGLPQKLTHYIQYLMDKNFEGLINLLYRIDVDENKIRLALKQNKDNRSAFVLTFLIIERLEKIIKSRVENTKDKNNNIAEDEKW